PITFNVDAVGPVTSAVVSGTPGSGNWFHSPVQVTVSGSDAGSGVSAIHVRSDGGAWSTYAGPFSIPTDGAHTVDTYGTDVVGHDGAIHSTAFGIDTIAPSTSLRPDKLPDARGRSCRFRRPRSEEHTPELQSRENLVCRRLLEK